MEVKSTGLRARRLGAQPRLATHCLCSLERVVLLYQRVGDHSVTLSVRAVGDIEREADAA